MAKITENTTIGEILKNYSNAKDVLTGFGMHCFACPMSQMETIAEAGMVHGLDIEFMLNKLNEDLVANKEEKTCSKKSCGCKAKKD
ncbi:MAG: DUF1858 domain-containing protein [Clostridia bacterium]|nr:DUF1858 domain-containing protein [Clostridia bacterium]